MDMQSSPHLVALEDVSYQQIVATLSKHDGFCSLAVPAKNGQQRFSIISSNPLSTLSFQDGFITRDGHTVIDTPANALREFLQVPQNFIRDRYFPFSGGVLGFLGFEGSLMLRELNIANNERSLPDGYFGLYDTIAVYDHIENQCALLSQSSAKRCYQLAEQILHNQADTSCAKQEVPKENGEDAHQERLSLRLQDIAQLCATQNSLPHFVQQKTLPLLQNFRQAVCAQLISTENIQSCFMTKHTAFVASSKASLFYCEHHDKDLIEVFKEHLPAKSVCGAAYKDALECINLIERQPRQLFGGAIGFVDNVAASFQTVEQHQLFTDTTVTSYEPIDFAHSFSQNDNTIDDLLLSSF